MSESKQYGIFKVERKDDIAVITLNSPGTLNAFTWKFPEVRRTNVHRNRINIEC